MRRRELLQGILGSAALRGLLRGQTPDKQLLNVSCLYTGTINSSPLRGRGKGTIDLSTIGPHDVTINYDQLPRRFHPFAVGASFITIGATAAKRHGQALNLWDLSHGNYRFERILTWRNFPASKIVVRAEVETKGLDFQLKADYAGDYNGPIDLSNVVSWEGVMTQAPDQVDEVGRAVVQQVNGKQFEVDWHCTYQGFFRKMNVPSQYARMNVERLNFADSVMRMIWTADVFEKKPE